MMLLDEANLHDLVERVVLSFGPYALLMTATNVCAEQRDAAQSVVATDSALAEQWEKRRAVLQKLTVRYRQLTEGRRR